MASPEQTLAAMGETWWTSVALSATLAEPPSTTRAALRRLQERGEVRYRPDTDEFQRYPVRGTLVMFLESDPDTEHNAAAVAEALPELGLTPALARTLLMGLDADGDIDCWFSARTGGT